MTGGFQNSDYPAGVNQLFSNVGLLQESLRFVDSLVMDVSEGDTATANSIVGFAASSLIRFVNKLQDIERSYWSNVLPDGDAQKLRSQIVAERELLPELIIGKWLYDAGNITEITVADAVWQVTSTVEMVTNLANDMCWRDNAFAENGQTWKDQVAHLEDSYLEYVSDYGQAPEEICAIYDELRGLELNPSTTQKELADKTEELTQCYLGYSRGIINEMQSNLENLFGKSIEEVCAVFGAEYICLAQTSNVEGEA